MFGQSTRDYISTHIDQNFYETVAYLDAYYAENDRGRGSGYKQYMRWKSETEGYVYPTGEMYNINARRKSAIDRLLATGALRSSDRTSTGAWEFEGPIDHVRGNGWNGGLGRINCLAFHPTNDAIVFAGTPAGGLWVSYDSTETWHPLMDDFPSIGVSSIAIDPNQPNTMYVLTGDGDSGHTYSTGVLKSVDGGLTWNTTGLSWGVSEFVLGYKLLMHPTNSNVLFAATSEGLWRSTDAGVSFDIPEVGHFTDIEYKPGTPSTMYAVTKKDPSGSEPHFWISTSSGAMWAVDDDTDFPVDSIYERIAIAVSPQAPEHVFLLFGGVPVNTMGQFSGLYKSTNSGSDFTLRSDSPNVLGYDVNGGDSEHQGGYDLCITVDPEDSTHVLIGGINVWMWNDTSEIWTLSSFWNESFNFTFEYTHADIHALEWKDGALYCGSDGGVYRSTNKGFNWTDQSTGLGIMQFYGIDVLDGLFAGGTQDNGSNFWHDSVMIATHSLGGDGFNSLIDYDDPEVLYQSDQITLYRSDDGGQSFTDITPATGKYWQAAWILDPTNPNFMFAGGPDVFRSLFAGIGGWTDLNAGFSENRVITSLAQGIDSTNRLYASNNVKIRRTNNAFAATPTWEDKTSGLPGSAWITSIVVDPDDADRLWVSLHGYFANQKVYFSPDGGDTWQNESGSLPNIPVRTIIYEPESNDRLYIGTDIGVYYRDDVIGDWVFYGNGAPLCPVQDLDIDGAYLYAGTFSRGLWSSSLYSPCAYSHVLTPTNDPGTDLQVYHATNNLSSTRYCDMHKEVLYMAGSQLTLLDGFEVVQGAELELKLQPCED